MNVAVGDVPGSEFQEQSMPACLTGVVKAWVRVRLRIGLGQGSI